jgi:IclR family transcriptional regulator, acetate operon repressor
MSRVQSIERAFAVLGTLADGPIGVTEVAERARLPKSTAARLLASLSTEQVVEQVPGETRWRLGPRIVTLAASVRPARSLIAVARPHLVELSSTVGEAAGLSVPDGSTVHYVDQVEGPHPVSVRDWTGTRIAMHAVSSGHVFLAHMRSGEIETLLAGGLERFTPRTLVDPRALQRALRDVERTGVAWTRDEYAEGISSVAAPIVNENGDVVAAVHVHGPSYRFPAAIGQPSIEEAVRSAAARITASLRT